ncbi:MAG: zinc ribbon domain-containing protein, partial [Deltaproteobacteria bacterium]|nr:zinc ribbon domain-containing protein [Deltaproteobacteria bacterium]
MECPKCKHISPTDDSVCKNCGYNLEAYAFLGIMKEELSGIGAYVNDLSKRFESLKERFERFEDLIPQASIIQDKASVMPDEKGDVSIDELSDIDVTAQEEIERIPTHPETTDAQGAKPQKEKRESEIKFGQKWLLIAGVVLTVLAVGWFLK